jgi:hypothetical protein
LGLVWVLFCFRSAPGGVMMCPIIQPTPDKKKQVAPIILGGRFCFFIDFVLLRAWQTSNIAPEVTVREFAKKKKVTVRVTVENYIDSPRCLTSLSSLLAVYLARLQLYAYITLWFLVLP